MPPALIYRFIKSSSKDKKSAAIAALFLLACYSGTFISVLPEAQYSSSRPMNNQIKKHSAEEYGQSGYFAAVRKGTLFSLAMDGKEGKGFEI